MYKAEMKSNLFKKIMQLFGLFIILVLAWLSIISNKSIDMPSNLSQKSQELNCQTSKVCLSEIITMARFDAISVEKIDEFFNECNLSDKKHNYRHYVCKNNFMQFVEDIELKINDQSIKYRSASRVNHLIFYGHELRLKRFIIFLESITNPN